MLTRIRNWFNARDAGILREGKERSPIKRYGSNGPPPGCKPPPPACPPRKCHCKEN